MARNSSPKRPQRLPQDHEQASHAPRPDAGATAAAKEALVLPSRASAIEQAHRVIRDTPELRHELVVQLHQSLHVDNLMLDSQALAEKLIGVQLHDLRSAA